MMLNMSTTTNYKAFVESASWDSSMAQEFYQQQHLQGQFVPPPKESIHSGQFMVSTFESEEAEEDDDKEITMPDPYDPNQEKANQGNKCTEVAVYVPKKVDFSSTLAPYNNVGSHLEIETSLSKLFKCMNLAYSQKLTSPKWNQFKGIRLRWKEKIRLNNVIWRCWHMQFIMKKKTPVCQFASPLDVDIHSNPTNILLEGKYWKRQFDVIKAEYRKWRKNCKPKAIGSITCDSRSEIDFLEYSPLSNDRNFINFTDDFSDTLFSSFNGPLIFPDQREIAREAGNADFIQPSLGPLQPNFEEDLADLLNFRPLPTVPEEGTEDLLKNADYNFSQIMGSEQMESSNMMSIQNQNAQQSSIEDATMVDLNMLNEYDATNVLKEVVNYSHQSFNNNAQQQQQQTPTNLIQPTKQVTFPMNPEIIPNNQQNLNNFPQGKGYGRISKAAARPFKRQINYDSKCPPTSHQTNLYHQMLAQQQQQQNQQQQQSMQQPQPYNSPPTAVIRPITGNYQIPQAPSILNMANNNSSITMVKSYSIPQTMQLPSSPQSIESLSNYMMTAQHHSPPLNTGNQLDHFKAVSHQSNDVSYKPYPIGKKSQQQRVNSFSNDSQQPILQNINQQANILMAQQQQQQQQQAQQQQMLPKEMIRSNSLPINSTFPKMDVNKTSQMDNNFAVPRSYAAKTSHKSRSRSNSVAPSQRGQLSSATSDPMLNKSALAQLLTNSNTNRLTNKQSSSTSAISTVGVQNIGFNNPVNTLNQQSVLPSYSKAISAQKQQQQSLQQQQQQQTIQHPLSPQKATSLPVSPPHMTSYSAVVPALSPESYDLDSPLSPRGSRDRRSGHIQAEQKRRCNIKNGFEALHSLIPQLQQNPNAKLSKAAMLQKGAEYIKRLGGEKSVLQKKIDALRKERDDLNNSLSQLHSILPANGAPISRQRTERVKNFYERYVHYRTRQNWKFWILGLILEPLLNSYTTTVSIASLEELRRTALLWIDQHCSLIDLRPAVSNKLRYLSMNTDILSENRSTLQEEVVKAMNNKQGQHPNLSGS